MQKLSVNGSVVVSTPQIVAMADARKGITMFKQENINIPVLGLIENMSYLLRLISMIKNITFLARMELKIYLKILILLFLEKFL